METTLPAVALLWIFLVLNYTEVRPGTGAERCGAGCVLHHQQRVPADLHVRRGCNQ